VKLQRGRRAHLEGAFAANGKKFESDEIMVRHDSTYDEKNEDRVREADQDAKQRATG
jgi:cytochrome c-type biogenesis protein CcmE